MSILSETALLVAVISFGLAATALARNFRNKVYIAYAAMCLLVSVWALSFVLGESLPNEEFYRFHLFFNIWLAPVGLLFVRALNRIRSRLSNTLLDLSIVASVLLSLALLLRWETRPVINTLIVFAPAFLTIHIGLLFFSEIKGLTYAPAVVKGLGPELSSRTKSIIYLGALVVMTLSVMNHIPQLGVILPSCGNVLLAIYLFFLGQAVSGQRLLNFGAMLYRFFVLLMMALLITIVYSLIFLWIENRPFLFFINSFIVSFSVLILLDPIRILMRFLTSRMISREHRKIDSLLKDCQQELGTVLTAQAFSASLLGAIRKILEPQYAAVFLLTDNGLRYLRLDSTDTQVVPAQAELIYGHDILEYCQKLKKLGELPILMAPILENEIDRSASEAQKEKLRAMVQTLKALGGNILIPLMVEAKVLGFIVVQAESPPEIWGRDWSILNLCTNYFTQAALTLQNLDVFVRQREKERLATLGEMAAGLAHEIRNPLGAIKGAAQFLDPSLDRPESKFLRIIVEESDRLNRVVSQFLDYSRPVQSAFEWFNFSRVVRQTVDQIRTVAATHIDIEVHHVPSEDIYITGSTLGIHQVIFNIVQNGMQALEGKVGGRLDVWLNVCPGNQEFELVIEDNGNGIAPQNLDRLFIPFFTTRRGGTGLGLSVTQKIVESHQGRIRAENRPEGGARFVLTFPFMQRPSSAKIAHEERSLSP